MSTVEPIKSKHELNEIRKFLNQQCFRNLLLFEIGINCGLRISDILNLDIKSVKNKDVVSIYEIKTRKYKRFPLNKKLQRLISKYTKNKNDNEPLFKTQQNKRMDRFTAYRILNNACKKLNLNINIGTHSLRKTFGYHFYKKYKDIILLQKILNHSSPNVTLCYIGLEQEQIETFCKNFTL